MFIVIVNMHVMHVVSLLCIWMYVWCMCVACMLHVFPEVVQSTYVYACCFICCMLLVYAWVLRPSCIMLHVHMYVCTYVCCIHVVIMLLTSPPATPYRYPELIISSPEDSRHEAWVRADWWLRLLFPHPPSPRVGGAGVCPPRCLPPPHQLPPKHHFLPSLVYLPFLSQVWWTKIIR